MLKKKKESFIAVIILAFFALCTLLPIYLMIAMSTKDQMSFITNFWGIQIPMYVNNYIKAWEVVKIYIYNTLKITFFTVIGVLAVSVLSGYAFAKMKFKGKEVFYLILLMFQMVPTGLLFIPMFLNVYKMGISNNHLGVILPNIGMMSIMPIMLTRGFFEGIPDSIFESAKIDGAKEYNIIFQLVIPLSKPVIGSVSLFTFFGAFNQFMWPYIVLSDDRLRTVTIGLNRLIGQYGTNFGFQMAAYAIVCVPLMILIMMTMKIYVEGVTLGSVKE